MTQLGAAPTHDAVLLQNAAHRAYGRQKQAFAQHCWRTRSNRFDARDI